MDHLAILKPSLKLLPKILSGQKTIESRWYQTKRSPWNKIQAGDKIYFKNSGQCVTTQATAHKIIQLEIKSQSQLLKTIKLYEKALGLKLNPTFWPKIPKYCILIWLKNPKLIQSFQINKAGFGQNSAWLSLPNINKIKAS